MTRLAGSRHLGGSSEPSENNAFHASPTGMVRKAVNQNDVSAYHLFDGNGQASGASRSIEVVARPSARDMRA
jgi:hypothetical protein